MLGDIAVADEIYIVCGYTDMRKSIDGLCAIIKDQLNYPLIVKVVVSKNLYSCFDRLSDIVLYLT